MELPNINRYKNIKETKTKSWQEMAIKIIKNLQMLPNQKSSVFKACKVDKTTAEVAYLDCEELGKLSVNYFFKVYYEIRKNKTN